MRGSLGVGDNLMQRSNTKWIIITHILLLCYSTEGIFSKLAAREAFLSIQFIVLYGIVLLILAVYALGWQQIIKHLPLTSAYANKAVTVVWGIIWGVLVFHEQVTAGKIIGAVLVILGVALYAEADYDAKS